MNIIIPNTSFRVALCVLLIFTVGSCSIATRMPESKYGEIDQNESKDYYIELKDGTNYAARKIAINDTTLTIYEINHSAREKYTEIAEDKLPYSIRFGDIDSIRARRHLIFLTCLVGVVAIVVIAGIIFSATMKFKLGEDSA